MRHIAAPAAAALFISPLARLAGVPYTILMRTLLLILALCAAAAPAGAAADKRAELARLLDDGMLPAFSYFLRENGGLRAAADEFALTSPDDPARRLARWRALDRLLYGGKYDKRGGNIRREAAKLPGSQWHFLAILDMERRTLYERLGNGYVGNLYENSVAPKSAEPRLCYERREALTRTMAPVQAEALFRNWRTEELTANMITVADRRGIMDDLYGGVHEAPCFVYDDGRTRVEIAADAWANSFTPAYTWWYTFDRDTHDYLYRAGGRDWCSERIQQKAVRAQIDARREAQKRAAPAAPPKSSTLNGIRGPGPF